MIWLGRALLWYLSMDTTEDDASWLEELLLSHSNMPSQATAEQGEDMDVSDDEWLAELLFSHRSDTMPLVGAGSSAPCIVASAVVAACSSAPHPVVVASAAACSSAPQGCTTVGAGLPAPGIACTRAEAKDAFISEAQSMGTLPNICVPEKEGVIWNLPNICVPEKEGVIWNLNGTMANPEMCGKQRLAAWLCLLGPAIFKVGIASDPEDRFFSDIFGYVLEERWHFMDVFWQGPANQCRQLEIDLIFALSLIHI